MNKILEINNLNKSFNSKLVLSDINFSLQKGEKIALTGSDGAGKTTLLRLIAGLLVPDNKNSNPILTDKLSPYKNHFEVKKMIGYMPQNFGLYEDLTVEENLEFYFGLKNNDKNQKEEIFLRLLNFSGLSDFKKRLAGALSGGMKQKLALACCLLTSPALLLLDEPSVGVDPLSRRNLIEMVKELSKKENRSIIWATSYLDEAKYFDKVILLQEGKIIYFGTVEEAKRAVQDRVYYAFSKNNIRKTLEFILNQNGVQDAAIEGEKIRIVFENENFIKNFPLKIEKTSPVFEDFVMSTLNKKNVFIMNYKNKIFQNDNMTTIEVENVSKKYKNFYAAKDISFNVKRGEVYGLLGPNGAGKSTIFKMLVGLIAPNFGSLKIMGIDILKNPVEAKKNFGYMAQKFSLFPNLSTEENIEFFKGIFGVDISVEDILEAYDLKKYRNTISSLLPLGYKQRLALICAVINHPPVLFLDEPTSGVDPKTRREFWQRINKLVSYNISVLVTTHFMEEAQFCDRIALIYQGKILKEGSVEAFVQTVKNKKNPTMEDAFIQIISGAEK